MQVFGRYEAVEELSRNPFGSVYKGRLLGDRGEPAHFIKTFSPPGVEGDALLTDPAVGAFLERAAVQKKAADAGQHVAPILDSGTAPGGAYYVSKLYPTSVARLVRGQVKLGAQDLHALISGIHQGLVQLSQSCQQAHGALDANSVLLGKRSNAGYTEIALAEPQTPQSANKAGTAGDVRALAQIVYQLVTFKTLAASGGYPAQLGPEWRRLKNGRAWLDFVNRILDPSASAEDLTLEKVGQDLRKLRIRPGLPWWVKVAAVLMLGGGVAFGFYAHHQHVVKTRYPGEWREYVQAYQGWFGVLWGERSQLGHDPIIDSEISAPLTSMDDFDPRHWAEATSIDPQSPPEHAGVPGKVHDALAVVHRIEATLQGKGKAWPALARARQARDAFNQRNWLSPREPLDKAFKELDTPTDKLRKAINTVIQTSADFDAVEQAWSPVQQQIQKFAAASGDVDPVLSKFEPYSRDQVNRAAQTASNRVDPEDWPQQMDAQLKAIAAALADAQKQGASAFAFLNRGEAVEWPKMRAESVAYKGATPVPQVFDLWARQAPEYLVWTVPDPRKGWDIAQKLEPIDQTLTRIADLVKQEKIEYPDLPTLQAQRQSIGKLRSEVESQKWSKQTHLAVEQGIQTANAQLAAFKLPSDAEIQRLIDHHTELTLAAIKAFQTESIQAPPPVVALFDTHRDALMASAAKVVKVGTLKADIERLRASLLKYDADFQEKLNVSSSRPWKSAAQKALETLSESRRVELLADALKSLRFDHDQPAEDPQFKARWEKDKGELRQYNDSAAAFVSAMNQVEDLLDRSYGPADPFDGKRTINDLVSSEDAFLQDADLKAAVAPVLGRIRQVADVSALQDPAQLIPLAQKQASPALRWAAWQRLMALSWPAKVEELPAAATLLADVRTMAGSIPDDARKKTLNDDLAAAGVKLADRFASAGSDDAAVASSVATVLSNSAKLGIGADHELPDWTRAPLSDRARFNCVVYVARKSLPAEVEGVKEPQAKEWINALSATLNAAIPAGKLPAKDALARQLAELSVAREDPEAAAGEGMGPGKSPLPGLKGTKGAKSGNTLTFTIGQEQLKFVLVKTAAPSRINCYMSVGEVSVGLVKQVMELSGKGPDDLDLTKPVDLDPLVALGWTVRGRRMDASSVWIKSVQGTAFYTPQTLGAACPEPSDQHPMQLVAPETALYIASLLGCRLPSTAEWKAALPLQSEIPNLRDAQWSTQLAHVKSLGLSTVAPWPDKGYFRPDDKLPPEGASALPWSAEALRRSLKDLGADQLVIPDPYQDGAAFYTPAYSGKGAKRPDSIESLVGNVAEIVWDDPATLEKRRGAPPTLKELRTLAWKNLKNVGVVGGSAISPPSIGLDRQAWPNDDTVKGYADVGFRLAFAATKPTIAQQFKELMESATYALAGK